MNVLRVGTFNVDGETVTGFFVSTTIEELKSIQHNPLMSRVELYPMTPRKEFYKNLNSIGVYD